jgi:hypothetical protein
VTVQLGLRPDGELGTTLSPIPTGSGGWTFASPAQTFVTPRCRFGRGVRRLVGIGHE